ncbi:hypothetical protein [Sciscionella marina]|uniref:hypothetical protein n=1 Tax=Sciscionella marina TaxID=508770 RepID=UPI00037FE7CF|nr:hypothetical protein [Sciscionella marina]
MELVECGSHAEWLVQGFQWRAIATSSEIGGARPELYERRGYADAMRTTLVEGIGGYLEASGSNVIPVHDGESESPEHLRCRDDAAREAGTAIRRSVARLG